MTGVKGPPMTSDPPVVFVVDDDDSVLKALGRLLRSHQFRAETFASAREFLLRDRPNTPGCLVLDVRMPGLDGLELQHKLNEVNADLPIIFITGHGDVPMSVRAMKAGAVDFLPKPFEDQDLVGAVRLAIANDVQARLRRADAAGIGRRVESLTPREREVMALVVTGLLNKQIGRELGVTEKTVKVHRGQVMRKMAAGSLAELVRMAEKAGAGTPARQADS
jgi:FixJ family two-component response regulator